MPIGRVGRMHLGRTVSASPGLRFHRQLSEPLTTFAGSSVVPANVYNAPSSLFARVHLLAGPMSTVLCSKDSQSDLFWP